MKKLSFGNGRISSAAVVLLVVAVGQAWSAEKLVGIHSARATKVKAGEMMDSRYVDELEKSGIFDKS